MRKPSLLAAALLLALFQVGTTHAEVSLPGIFTDHMVLQQKQTNKVWGRAGSGESITVAINGQSKTTTADSNGDWEVMIDPIPAGGPYELNVKGSNEITIQDVLVGEVWICSGQSNMEWPVARANDPDLEIATANFPKIRSINFPNTGSQEPVWTHDNEWMVCSPDTVGGFSAVGYFFGRQLYQALGVPIGLVNNSWGGSAADAWIRRDLLESDPKYAKTMERWKKTEANGLPRMAELEAKKNKTDKEKQELRGLQRQLNGNQRPSNIYNGVLKSHLGYGIKGAIWYQGESNASRAFQYRHVFPKMIQNWRDEWGAGEFPFYWVQLADFRDEKAEPAESDWAELREAQTMTLSALPNTGEAVIIDIGEGKDIHPRNKVIVGQRLARWALANQYGYEIAYHSPTYSSMEKEGDKIVLTFEHVNGGWRPFDVRYPVGFAIAGEDKKFVWADAVILKDGRIEVRSQSVPDPVAVRYAWADNPVCNMYDTQGLPLTPFRTDDWPGITVDKF